VLVRVAPSNLLRVMYHSEACVPVVLLSRVLGSSRECSISASTFSGAPQTPSHTQRALSQDHNCKIMNPATFTDADGSLTRHALQTGFMEGPQASVPCSLPRFTALVLIILGGPAHNMFLVTFICLARSTDSKRRFFPSIPQPSARQPRHLPSRWRDLALLKYDGRNPPYIWLCHLFCIRLAAALVQGVQAPQRSP
jgi:hypothetical protein